MRKHFGYYLSFLFILFAGFFLIFQVQGQKNLQILFVILLAFLYMLWGILHHVIHHGVSMRIVIEYFVVALLGVAIIVFILNGGL